MARLAQPLVHDPAIVILDEPTAGVDPLGAEAMSELILQLRAQGKTVLITSHLLSHMEAMCDRVALLDRGRLLLEGAMNELAPAAERRGVWMDALPPAEREELERWLAVRGRKAEAIVSPGLRLDRTFARHIRARETVVAAAGN